MINEKEITLAKKIAYKIGSKWSLVDVEDVAGELVLWLFENREHVTRYRVEEGGEGKLFIALRREASKYCAREQAARSGGELSISDRYTIAQIERAMPYVFEDILESLSREHTTENTELAIAIALDLKGALMTMPPQIREVLTLRFRDGMSYDEIGQLTGLSDRGAKGRVDRALKRMLEALEGDDADLYAL